MGTRNTQRWKRVAVGGVSAALVSTYIWTQAGEPVTYASSFWPETVAGLAEVSDLVVQGEVRGIVAHYRGGPSGVIGGDPSDDGVPSVVLEVHVTRVIGGAESGGSIFVTYLDTDAYRGLDMFPREAILFLRRTEIDPTDAEELAPYQSNLFTPLGTQGLFAVDGARATSASPEMRQVSGDGKGKPIPIEEIAGAVAIVFSRRDG